MTKRVMCAVVLLVAVAAMRAASVPVGVYAMVERVVFEPGDGDRQRAQVWGTFAVWDQGTGAGFRAPERGYLYYRCPAAQVGACQNEWADLKAISGTGETVGFGSRSLLAGRVRPSGERASSPEPYPMQFGLVRMGSSARGGIFDQLKAVARGR